MPNQGNALGQLAMPGMSMNPLGQMAYGNHYGGNPMPPGMVSGQQFDPNNMGMQMIRGNPQMMQWHMQRMQGQMGQQPGMQPAVNPGVAPQQQRAPLPSPSIGRWGR